MSSPLSYSDKVSLIEKANALMLTLQDHSIQNLALHIHLFKDLSHGLQRAAQVLEESHDATTSTVIASTAAMGQRLSVQPSVVFETHDRATKLASAALLSALNMAHDLQKVSMLMVPLPQIDCQQKPQEVHIQNIYALQKRRPSKDCILRDKMLLLCACQSLSADFRRFELHNGWTPKRDELVRRILAGEEPQIQKMGKTLKNYVSSLRTSVVSDRSKFYEAIRLGLKLEVLEAIGASVGLGDCVSFLLGFECVRLSRLSYSSLACLSKILVDGMLRSKIAKSVSSLMPWWREVRARYDELCRDPTPRISERNTSAQQTWASSTSDSASWEVQSRLPLPIETAGGVLPPEAQYQDPQPNETEWLQPLPEDMFLSWPELELSGVGETGDIHISAHGGKAISAPGFTTNDSSCLPQTYRVDDTTPSTQNFIFDVCGN